MKFIVKYSQEKDFIPYLNNLWKSTWIDYGKNSFEIGKKYFPVEFMEAVKNAETKTDTENIITEYWKSTRSKNFSQDTDLIIKWFNKILNEEKDLIIKTLEKAYSEKFPFNEITVYLTTFYSCPYYYEEKWYMAQRSSSLMNLFSVSIHELNHFMFYYYWREYLRKQNISNEKIEYLKESFAVLTSTNPKENIEKPNILTIQNFVKANKDKPIKEIIDLVIEEGLLS